ncbi:MAG: molecular chaperone HtpG [Alphaproteobacteria bacterium]|nr:molecular chaperone HtpG [Alphaproteobacteria bacterium]
MAKTKKTKSGGETRQFEADVSRLLDIVANALYSEKEIFLRELISNAADACDRLRYAAITTPALIEGDSDFRIALTIDKDARTLTIADNGIGMTHDDLANNLGTIARSGTSAFVDQLSGDSKKDVSLIGQFGVGFYSAFMVSDEVEVISRHAEGEEAWRWSSDGKGEFTIEEAAQDSRGTTITIHLKEDETEFTEPYRIRHIVKTYSDHIAVPITLIGGEPPKEDVDGEGDSEEEAAPETINSASAIWTRSRGDVTEQQHKEFYHHISHLGDEPWLTAHFRVEGVIEYAGLLYVPTDRPMDLFHQDRPTKVSLYVKRVFITDNCEELLPRWLRFVRGVVDSEDLPLNVSREMLQNNPVLSKIKTGITTRLLNELKKQAENEPDAYAAFWENFGPVLKEGLYEAFGDREALLELSRFKSTKGDDLTSLKDYVERMKDGQEAIYYITGSEIDTLRMSPQLEGFEARGVEVLLLTDPVDEFWLPMIGAFDEKSFKSVTRGGDDLAAIKSNDADDEAKDEESSGSEDIDRLIAALKVSLGEDVKDVRPSQRLTESAVCLVADDGDMDMNLERMLKAHNQLDAKSPRVLEINPKHALIKQLASTAESDGADSVRDAALLLLDQARILEGETLSDPAAFARRMSSVMQKSLSA